MEKNWLIRTKNNHILGPVSKEKVRELVNNGSIKGDDEICSGNGYWFYVRETDLVEKYLNGEDDQEFNPVSEAETVLANSVDGEKKEVKQEFSDDITKVGFSLSELESESESDDQGKKK